jgi:hypothetical protein
VTAGAAGFSDAFDARDRWLGGATWSKKPVHFDKQIIERWGAETIAGAQYDATKLAPYAASTAERSF